MIKIYLQLSGSTLSEVTQGLQKHFAISTQIENADVIITDTHELKNKSIDVSHNMFVISDLSDDENIALICEHGIRHLVGKNPEIYLDELINNIKKIESGNIWGVKHYLGNDFQEKVISFSDTVNMQDKVTQELKHFQFDGYFSSPTDYLQVMANELLSNSLYKGPNKKRAQIGIEAADRKSPAFLKGAELVQTTLGCNDKGVALSVQDSFGELTHQIIVSNLMRSFKEKSPLDKKDGAGLGLYLTFLHSNQFIINLKSGFRTEVICIIDKTKRYKQYKSRIRSLHFFEEVQSEKTHS